VPLFHGGHGHLPNLRCAVALHALSPEGEPSMGMLAAQMQVLLGGGKVMKGVDMYGL